MTALKKAHEAVRAAVFAAKTQLHQALVHICRTAETPSDRGFFDHVLIEDAGTNCLRLKATDGHKQTVEIELACDLADEITPRLVPAREFRDALKTIPARTRLSVAVAEANGISIVCGGAAITLPGFPADADTWKPRGGLEGAGKRYGRIIVDGSDLAAWIDSFAHAMAKQEVRYYLNGACLEFARQDDGTCHLTFCATDAHRLACETVSLPSAPDGMDDTYQLIICRDTVAQLRRLLGTPAKITTRDVTIGISERGIEFYSVDAGWTLHAVIVDGKYPDFRRVIPDGNANTCITFDRDAMVDAVRRALAAAHPKWQGVTITASAAGLAVSAEFEGRSVAIVVPGTFRASIDGQSLPQAFFGVNGRYLLDYLRAIDGGQVTMTTSIDAKREMNDEGKKVVVPDAKGTVNASLKLSQDDGRDRAGVIMTMRL